MKNYLCSFLSRWALPGLMSLILLSPGLALADTIATVMINNNGVITADGSDTGNINIATTFVIDMYTSVADGTGDLAGLPAQAFGNVTVNLNNPGALTFNSVMFGTFTATSITTTKNVPSFLDLQIQGNWTPGTFPGTSRLVPPVASQLDINFTQIPAGAGIIGSTSTFSVSTPEPSTICMILPALAALLFKVVRRNQAGRDYFFGFASK